MANYGLLLQAFFVFCSFQAYLHIRASRGGAISLNWKRNGLSMHKICWRNPLTSFLFHLYAEDLTRTMWFEPSWSACLPDAENCNVNNINIYTADAISAVLIPMDGSDWSKAIEWMLSGSFYVAFVLCFLHGVWIQLQGCLEVLLFPLLLE